MNLKTIASKAGVSTATVSNVINGNHHKVSQDTIDRVRKIIEEMNYSPNATARSLASKESRIISLVVPNMGDNQNMDPYTTHMLSLLEQAVRREGYYLMVRCVDRCREIAQLVSSWNVDGVVLLGAYPDEVEEIEALLGSTPSVYTDTYASDVPIANIGVNDYKGGFLSARYLLGRGHRRIAFVGPNVNSPGVIQERYRGFCAALRERSMSLAEEDIYMAATESEAGVEIGKAIALSGRGYTAVAAMSDTLALGLNLGLQLSGLNVPEDVSIIGFDNLRLCRFTTPALTTISQDLEEKARLTAMHLFRMIREKEKYAVNEILDVSVVERQTVRRVMTV